MNFKNMIIKTQLSLLLGIMMTNLTFCQNVKKEFKWPDNKKAAVCFTFDDGQDSHLDNAIPLLDSFGIKGTFYCTGNSESLNTRTPEWKKIVEDGHELGNHTLFHPCDRRKYDWVKPEYDLSKYSRNQIRTELYTANTLLKAIDKKTSRTFGYTCSNSKVWSYSKYYGYNQRTLYAELVCQKQHRRRINSLC